MERYYKQRFEAQRRLAQKVAPFMEANEILEKMRSELREIISGSMEACILLLDPEAGKYTRPLQCALYDRPINCLKCKRHRPAIQQAIARKKAVVVTGSQPVVRHDGTSVPIGPEAAVPVFAENQLLAVVSVVAMPETRFSSKEFFLLQDFAETVGYLLVSAKKHWAMTQEKIRINQMLAHLSPFVPQSVRKIVEDDPQMLEREKEKRDVSILFLDLEGYTRLSIDRPEDEVNALVEKIFSSFVDPIHRSHGDINETAGDGLMIIFKDDDPRVNAVNAVKAAIDIRERNHEVNRELNLARGPVNVNMGINTGEALVGMTRMKGALDTRMTYTASGTVTNLAARLAEYAQGGDILFGERTRSMIENLWPVYDRGKVGLKGIEAPVQVYSLFKDNPGGHA
ncbi:class 3 adenylate cyclase [Desulfosalsimonas propionicica]|uniref:Class 3 adenylate cyclase n=1 Tax=Desulfosalsimonas propionicica TaxID=332175 RepID=A0A7W0CBD3_9BACT|nr:adenylate/guanylate cyclase domain-containing protein [Desulfosalsimonas propionicica]MBA2882629.1 class 3 adenylate cyclase [Desulfosalsimonas propionicica]